MILTCVMDLDTTKVDKENQVEIITAKRQASKFTIWIEHCLFLSFIREQSSQ